MIRRFEQRDVSVDASFYTASKPGESASGVENNEVDTDEETVENTQENSSPAQDKTGRDFVRPTGGHVHCDDSGGESDAEEKPQIKQAEVRAGREGRQRV
ncbi:hypothetical protein E2C01_008984 [Portunus trituberculatus]|uniref:Uncharacterized protein n=1 Tax=Portunus trituberculatus TaxID=210409 RepID=A0A5B7D533_PORTR|nr:hypothetical protein [Portunus trituberculatus]